VTCWRTPQRASKYWASAWGDALLPGAAQAAEPSTASAASFAPPEASLRPRDITCTGGTTPLQQDRQHPGVAPGRGPSRALAACQLPPLHQQPQTQTQCLPHQLQPHPQQLPTVRAPIPQPPPAALLAPAAAAAATSASAPGPGPRPPPEALLEGLVPLVMLQSPRSSSPSCLMARSQGHESPLLLYPAPEPMASQSCDVETLLMEDCEEEVDLEQLLSASEQQHRHR
jgi:hypothetical protein